MSEPASASAASPRLRAAARAIDTVVTAALAFLMTFVNSCTSFLIAYQSAPGWEVDTGLAYALLVPLSALALIPLACYEIVPTARRGRTFGKRCMGIQVVLWDDEAGRPASGPEAPMPIAAECAGWCPAVPA